MKVLILLLFPLQLFCQSTSILFQNVNIIDVEKGRVIASQNVLVEGTKIKAISTKSISAKGATIINGKGKYLIPGLWDMHVHVFNNVSERAPNEYYFPGFIANGITSIREMWTKPKNMHYVQGWRNKVATHPGTVPRFASVGTLVDGAPSIWPNSDTVTTADEAKGMVRKIKASGVDFFKVYGRLSREAYFAIADECKKLNFSFAGHVPNGIKLAEAANAGQKSQEHLGFWDMFIELSDNEEKFKNIKLADLTPALRTELLQSLSVLKTKELAAVFVKNGTWLCPTIIQYQGAMLGDDDVIKLDHRIQYADSFDRKAWTVFTGRFTPETRPLRELRLQKGLDVIRLLHQNGVLFLAGTDLGNPFIYAGFSLHDELELFVKAGLTPLAALQTATLNPAKYIGKEKEIGTVSEGKLADLVLLDANPLTDIINTRKINAVVANGRLLQRRDLDKMLEDAKEKVNASNLNKDK